MGDNSFELISTGSEETSVRPINRHPPEVIMLDGDNSALVSNSTEASLDGEIKGGYEADGMENDWRAISERRRNSSIESS